MCTISVFYFFFVTQHRLIWLYFIAFGVLVKNRLSKLKLYDSHYVQPTWSQRSQSHQTPPRNLVVTRSGMWENLVVTRRNLIIIKIPLSWSEKSIFFALTANRRKPSREKRRRYGDAQVRTLLHECCMLETVLRRLKGVGCCCCFCGRCCSWLESSHLMLSHDVFVEAAIWQ